MKIKRLNYGARSLRRIFFSFVILFLSGCATVPSGRIPREPAGYALQDLCVRYRVACSLDSMSQVITLKKDHISARAIVGSDIAIVDNKKERLSRSVWISQGIIYVPWDFRTKVLQPMLVKASPLTQRFRKIMIDAGHGGKDPGGIGFTGVQEKEVALDIALRLEQALRHQGVDVVLTRKTDIFLDLSERTRLARDQGVDLFISIHANIARNRNVQGVEVFYARPLDEHARQEIFNPSSYRCFFRNFSMKQDNTHLKAILTDMLYVHKQHESYWLAKHLTERLARELRTPNRGHKEANFYVVKNILVPSILVEVGFLSNPQEEQRLSCSRYRQTIVDSLVQGLKDYVGP